MDQNIVQRLHVMSLRDLSDILSIYNPDCLRGVERSNLGAVISVEPFKAEPNKPAEYWRLSTEATQGISRHFTEVFYADPLWKQAKQAQTEHDAVKQVVQQRLTSFSETLKFADDFLKAPENGTKNLVVHSFCSKNFSPAVMLGILADQFPAASASKIIDTVRAINMEPTAFASNEIAFVDAATKRGGELVKVWGEGAKRFGLLWGKDFELELALKLQENYTRIIAERTAAVPIPPPSEIIVSPRTQAGEFPLAEPSQPLRSSFKPSGDHLAS